VARRRLRRGYRLEAAELLDRCVRALQRDLIDDPALIERWRYAHDRCTGNGQTSLAPDVLERVIRWVTREELHAGEQALAAGHPFAAARFMIAADRIDDRGTRSAFLHATGLFRAAQESSSSVTVASAVPAAPFSAASFSAASFSAATPGGDSVAAHLQRAERCFRRASTLLLRAYGDPALRLECDHMTATIAAELAALSERRAGTDRMAAACACLVDFDSLARHYDEVHLLSPSAQAGFRSSLGALAGRIRRLLHRSPPSSAEARLLVNLAGEVTAMQQTLTYARAA
jgi:hypothetical protein